MNALALRRSSAQPVSLDSIALDDDYASTSDLPVPSSQLEHSYSTIDVAIDPATEACWCTMQPPGRPSFTRAMLQDLERFHADWK